jgi:hypothetical protein
MAIFTLQREIEYIPKSKDNEKAEKPIKFKMKALTQDDYHQHVQVAWENDRMIQKIDDIGMFRSNFISVENLTLNIDGKSYESPTADQILLFCGLYWSVRETITYLTNQVQLDESKKKD